MGNSNKLLLNNKLLQNHNNKMQEVDNKHQLNRHHNNKLHSSKRSIRSITRSTDTTKTFNLVLLDQLTSSPETLDAEASTPSTRESHQSGSLLTLMTSS